MGCAAEPPEETEAIVVCSEISAFSESDDGGGFGGNGGNLFFFSLRRDFWGWLSFVFVDDEVSELVCRDLNALIFDLTSVVSVVDTFTVEPTEVVPVDASCTLDSSESETRRPPRELLCDWTIEASLLVSSTAFALGPSALDTCVEVLEQLFTDWEDSTEIGFEGDFIVSVGAASLSEGTPEANVSELCIIL